MRRETSRRAYEAIAVLSFGLSTFLGGLALVANNDVDRAESAALAQENQGNPQAAAEWQTFADGREDARNLSLTVGVINLISAGAFGLISVSFKRPKDTIAQDDNRYLTDTLNQI